MSEVRSIWKFELNGSVTDIKMPIRAKLLAVQTQHNEPHLWAMVCPDNHTEIRSFRIRGTGHDFSTEASGEYVGTFQDDSGAFVGHLFEVTGCEEVGAG